MALPDQPLWQQFLEQHLGTALQPLRRAAMQLPQLVEGGLPASYLGNRVQGHTHKKQGLGEHTQMNSGILTCVMIAISSPLYSQHPKTQHPNTPRNLKP